MLATGLITSDELDELDELHEKVVRYAQGVYGGGRHWYPEYRRDEARYEELRQRGMAAEEEFVRDRDLV